MSRVCGVGICMSDRNSTSCFKAKCSSSELSSASRGSNQNSSIGSNKSLSSGQSQLHKFTQSDCKTGCEAVKNEKLLACSTQNALMDIDWLTCVHKTMDEVVQCRHHCGKIKQLYTKNPKELVIRCLPNEPGEPARLSYGILRSSFSNCEQIVFPTGNGKCEVHYIHKGSEFIYHPSQNKIILGGTDHIYLDPHR